MKTLSLILTGIIMLTSASSKSQSDNETMKQQIINADIAMSNLAEKAGFFKALGEYADENFVKFNGGDYPTIGKAAFLEKHKDSPGPTTLTWKPESADVAASGDLGYTWGYWQMILPDTTVHGNYFTVWKKQPDGKWKMALDGGNATPGPKE